MQEQKEQIGRNSQKFVRNSYEFRTNFVFRENSHKFIHVKFVRNLYEICTNFVRISYEFRPICQYTKQTHKQAHIALAWAGDAPCPGPRALGQPPRWDRVHQVPQRGRPTRRGNAGQGEVDVRLRIDIVPLGDLQLVHAAHEEQRALLADLDDREVGGRGQVGGPAGTVWGGRRRGPGQPPPPTTPPSQPPPSPPTTPGPRWGGPSWTNPKQRPGPPLGGPASKCVVLGWWCLCRGSGVHKLKTAPCSPSLESGRAGNP